MNKNNHTAKIMDLKERFLNYVSYDTQSSEESGTFPSTEKQKVLLAALRDEMQALGMTEVTMDRYGYVMGTVPATPGCENAPVIGFIAHVDTSPDMSGKDVKPRVIEEYDGGDIALNSQLTMRVADFPELEFFKGHTLIHTDGTTLLGADDKAGVAEIMTAAEYLLAHPEIKHGKIRIGFTPDEEVGSGAGLRIRRMAKAADELPPTERVKRIAEIFSHFRNPDKETVLTPWRVVNLHLSNMVGGYCFLNEQFDPQEVLEEPRLVDQGQVTEDIFLNSEARILEMNSKSGLYPLYMAYSLYAMKLPGPEDKLPLEQTQALWQETVEQQIFVLCKTRMAESITRRTLVGYQDWTVNTTYIPHLLERMENDPQRLAKKLQRTDTWGKE